MNPRSYWDCCPDCPDLPAVPPVQVGRSARGSGLTADYLGSCGHVWTTDWAREHAAADSFDGFNERWVA